MHGRNAFSRKRGYEGKEKGRKDERKKKKKSKEKEQLSNYVPFTRLKIAVDSKELLFMLVILPIFTILETDTEKLKNYLFINSFKIINVLRVSIHILIKTIFPPKI